MSLASSDIPRGLTCSTPSWSACTSTLFAVLSGLACSPRPPLCYALYRWGGTFAIAGFLFNGGLAGFQYSDTLPGQIIKGLISSPGRASALSMLVTQRGLLYALPVGLLLLYQWRAKFFPRNQGETLSQSPASSEPGGLETAAPSNPPRPPLPFWVELSLYATMPLFHVHTFMALEPCSGLLVSFPAQIAAPASSWPFWSVPHFCPQPFSSGSSPTIFTRDPSCSGIQAGSRTTVILPVPGERLPASGDPGCARIRLLRDGESLL